MSRPLKIFFDLKHQERWHQEEWKKIFSEEIIANQTEVLPVAEKNQADCILQTRSRQNLITAWKITSASAETIPVVVWDSDDHPSGIDPGLYCSLPRPLHEPSRHGSFCYPIVYNECVEPFDQKNAEYLFCFAGGVTSGLRGRLVSWIKETKFDEAVGLKVQNGPWQQMFDRSGLAVKKEYADIIKRSRFVLCPRGNGVGSIRFFEVLKAGRVPVVLSDDYVLPDGIDWESCTIRIKEKNFQQIPKILASYIDRWPAMALQAEKISKEKFEGSALLANLGKKIKEILHKKAGQSLGHKISVQKYAIQMQARRLVGRYASKLRQILKKEGLAASPKKPK